MDRRNFLAAAFASVGLVATNSIPLISNVVGDNEVLQRTAITYKGEVVVEFTVERLPNGDIYAFSRSIDGDDVLICAATSLNEDRLQEISKWAFPYPVV